MIYELLEYKDLVLALTLVIGFFVMTYKINTIPDDSDSQW